MATTGVAVPLSPKISPSQRPLLCLKILFQAVFSYENCWCAFLCGLDPYPQKFLVARLILVSCGAMILNKTWVGKSIFRCKVREFNTDASNKALQKCTTCRSFLFCKFLDEIIFYLEEVKRRNIMQLAGKAHLRHHFILRLITVYYRLTSKARIFTSRLYLFWLILP